MTIIARREEWRSLVLNVCGNISIHIFDNDPILNMRVFLDLPTLSLIDKIPSSEAALLFGINSIENFSEKSSTKSSKSTQLQNEVNLKRNNISFKATMIF